MNWLDVAGCPGSGKSTISYPIWGDKSVGWDGKLPPAYWRQFLDEITVLCELVQDHPSFTAVVRMNDRSAKKMATVERMLTYRRYAIIDNEHHCITTFIQTGLVQRILGFGWRLQEMGHDINLIRTALWRMPVSVGVAFLEADLDTIYARNRAREKDPRTAHENRSAQVAHMLPSIALAKQVLRERGIPVIEIDVQHQPIEAARAQLLDFANQEPRHTPQVRSCGQGPLILAPPPWWQ